MSAPRFAYLGGRTMWERCDHVGTRIEGSPAAVVLAPASAAPAQAAVPDAAALAAWEARLGSAVVLPCAPDQCDSARVLRAVPGAPLAVLVAAGWLPLPAAPTRPAVTAALDFVPAEPPPAPAAPDAIALDPTGCCWLLDRAGHRLLQLSPGLHVQAVEALPPGIDPGFFACSAHGLVVTDRSAPRLLVQPWGGAWHGHAIPAAGAPARILALAADPAWAQAVALVDAGSAGWQLMRVAPGGVTLHALPMAQAPLQLLMTAADRVLVGERNHRPDSALPYFFREYLLHGEGVEAEAGHAVRGFDGRALWRAHDGDGTRVMASTADGARALFAREPALGSAGSVETWALDSGHFGCTWHRLFVDLCLPPDCSRTVEARTADDLPPFEIRRLARLPADRAGDSRPAPVDDPWPPLGSRVADEAEGWVVLGVPDRLAAQADVTPAGRVGTYRNDDPLAAWRRPVPPPPAAMVTLEYLLTAPPGRYLWLRLRLTGTRRQGPALFALRARFPRPSLLDYLPAYWKSDPEGADGTERALALFEGWTSTMDERIDVLRHLVDPALAPAEALPWLASFVALSVDERIGEGVRRTLLASIAGLYRQRGTVPGLSRLLSILAEAPVQIVEGFRLRRPSAAFVGDGVLGPGLELGGEAHPTGGASIGAASADWERALAGAHAALRLRRALDDAPCPAEAPADPLPDDALLAFYRRHAHRFTVIVARACTAPLAAVLEEAIENNKPAHTLHRLCWLDAGYRVGSASLVGISHLGARERASPAVLGRATLSAFSTLHHGRRDDRHPHFEPMNRWEAS